MSDELLSLLQVALTGLLVIAVLAVLTWVASLLQHDVSLVDRMWPLYIAGAGLVYYWLLPEQGERGTILVALGLAWGLRLCVYISFRNWGHGEDRRYQAIRARNQPNFAVRSLYLVFAVQTVLAWIVSTPFLAGLVGSSPLGWLDWFGIALAVFGIAFEAVADAQMSRFKAIVENNGKVMDRGLWRYTRHPNYFGETCTWWGLWLIAVSAGWGGAWSVVSPVVMTILLLKVSGVSLLEKDIGERRPAYREYVAKTNAFVPGLPKGSA